MDSGYEDYLNEEFERHSSWLDIEHSERIFVECQAKIKIMRCPVHKKRGYAEWEYTENHKTHCWVRKACCLEFANEIAQLLRDTNAFNLVSIDLGWPHTKKPKT